MYLKISHLGTHQSSEQTIRSKDLTHPQAPGCWAINEPFGVNSFVTGLHVASLLGMMLKVQSAFYDGGRGV